MMRLTIKGGPSSGWYAPPEGTHSGEEHRAVGSGKVGLPKKRAPAGVKRGIIPVQHSDMMRQVEHLTHKNIMAHAKGDAIAAARIEKQAIDNLRDHVRGKPVCVNVHAEIAHKILDDGRLKNQHETGTSGGELDNEFRRNAELKSFYYGDAPPTASDLPIYGYIDDGPKLAMAAMGEGYRASWYGDVTFVLKDSVKSRTTVTVDDSLNGFTRGEMVGTPLTKVGLEGINGKWRTAYNREWDTMSYIETQIHGSITLGDISRIIVRPLARAPGARARVIELETRARALGIALEYGV